MDLVTVRVLRPFRFSSNGYGAGCTLRLSRAIAEANPLHLQILDDPEAKQSPAPANKMRGGRETK